MINNAINNFYNNFPTLNYPNWNLQTNTLKKVWGIFLGFLIFSTSKATLVHEEKKINYSEDKELNGLNLEFPTWLQRCYRPGLISSETGERFCKIEKKFPKLSECDWFSKKTEHLIFKEKPEEGIEIINSLAPTIEKGAYVRTTTDLGTGIFEIYFGENPVELKNYKALLENLEKNFLENEQFFDQDPDKIVEAIKNTHKILLQNLPYAPEPLGEFRSNHKLVMKAFQENGLENAHIRMRNNGATQKDIQIFDQFFNKTKNDTNAVDPSDEELKSLNFLGYIPPSPEKIEEKMLKFAGEFKRKGKLVKKGKRVVENAAWIHEQIAKIQPFDEGNGRLARIWMNAVFLLGRHPPIVFPNDDSYSDAIDQSQRGKGDFVTFLREVISWNKEQANLPH